jgi:hypothetical protein
VKKKTVRRRSVTFDDVRKLALSMPEVHEVTAYGIPAFKVGKARLVGQPVQRPDVEPQTLGIMVSFEERDRLLAARPDIYYVTEHYLNYPAVLARLPKMTKTELRELLGVAWAHAMERQRPAKKKRAKG